LKLIEATGLGTKRQHRPRALTFHHLIMAGFLKAMSIPHLICTVLNHIPCITQPSLSPIDSFLATKLLWIRILFPVNDDAFVAMACVEGMGISPTELAADRTVVSFGGLT
jgi:hypothetical protein